MLIPKLKMLGVAFATLVTLSSVSGAEIVVVDQHGERWEETVRLELRDSEALRKTLQAWREKDYYICPREGLSGDERQAAVDQAKELLRRNWETYAVERMKDPPPLDGMFALEQAQKQCGKVLAALGRIEDAAWLLAEPEPFFTDIGDVAAQIYARHGIGFSKLDDQDVERWQNWVVAVAMAKQKDKGALDWMVSAPSSGAKTNLGAEMVKLLALNRHPSATPVAKEVIDRYLAERGEGKGPGDYFTNAPVLPWAILQIHMDPGASDYQARIEGIAISENVCGEVLWAGVTDPRPLIEMAFGVKGALTDWEKYEIEIGKWPTAKLRAAIANRPSRESQDLIAFYKESALQSGLIDDWAFREDLVANLVNQRVTMNMSAQIPAEMAAHLVKIYSDSPNTRGRFREAPWIRMNWLPDWLAPIIGKENTRTVSLDRLATFPHERLVEKLAKQTGNSKVVQDSFLLYHKVLSPAFEAPLRLANGGNHAPTVRLEGEFGNVGIQSHVQMVGQRKGEGLTVGFRVTSVHYDDGGLGSAIGKFHEKLAVIDEDSGRSMIGEVRWDGRSGAEGKLEFSRTVEGGVHVFKGTIPGGDVSDVYLRYEWTPPGAVYVLSHPLYEPWFALE